MHNQIICDVQSRMVDRNSFFKILNVNNVPIKYSINKLYNKLSREFTQGRPFLQEFGEGLVAKN